MKKIRLFYKYLILMILTILLIYCLTDFIFAYSQPSHYIISWIAFLISVLCPVFIIISFNRYYGYALALLMYLILTQFGTCIVVYVIPLTEIVSRGYYNTDWIYSSNYPIAVQLGIIATICYTLGVVWFGRKQEKRNIRKKTQILINQKENNKGIIYIGIFLICLVLVYTIIMMASGKIDLFGSYGDFLNFSHKYFASWGMMIVLYATGFIFVIATGNKKQINLAIVLFSIMAFFLLVTGNKGEVFYAVLAALGVYLTKQQKVNIKIILFTLIAFFIIIPSVSVLRNEGVLTSLHLMGASFSKPFLETGGQIRLTIFLLDEFQLQIRDYLYGFSYYNPLINIFNRLMPFIPRLVAPADFNFDTNFANMGFSQVAESFANFGILGVIIFFVLLGSIVSKFDSLNITNNKRALYGGWLVIFINMTRNVFAFVLGQMLVVYILWFIGSFIGKKLKIND